MRATVALAVCLLGLVVVWGLSRVGRTGRDAVTLAADDRATTDLDRTDVAVTPPPARTPLAGGTGREVSVQEAPEAMGTEAASEPSEPAPVYGSVHGSIQDADGRAIDSGRVRAVNHRLARVSYGRIDEGHYGILGLVPGRYWVCADADGRVVEQEVQLSDQPVRLDLVLPRARVLEVHVRDGAGRAVVEHEELTAPLVVVITELSPGARHDGPELARLLAPTEVHASEGWGRVALDATGPVHASLVLNERVLATESVAPDSTGVTLRMPDIRLEDLVATLRFQLVDGDGAPVHYASCGVGKVRRFTDADGRAVLEGCAAGHVVLRAAHSGFLALEREVELEPGEDRDLGKVTLPPSVQIAGRVQGLEPGQPWELSVRALPDGPAGPHSTPVPGTGGFQPAPTFRVDCPPGRYAVAARVFRGGRSHARLVDVRGESVEGLVFELLTTTDVVLQPESPGWKGARYSILDDQGLPVVVATFERAGSVRQRLVPGPYTLVVSRDGRIERTVPFEAEGELTQIPFE